MLYHRMLTKVFFVRHAQPEHNHEDDRTRPLTAEGKADSKIVLETLKDKQIDAFYCSPYKRSLDTIQETADYYGMTIRTDERLREREKGDEGNTHGTALSAIMNHYRPAFGCDDFLRIIDWMPYIVELDFDGQALTAVCEHAHIEKEFKGNTRADKP